MNRHFRTIDDVWAYYAELSGAEGPWRSKEEVRHELRRRGLRRYEDITPDDIRDIHDALEVAERVNRTTFHVPPAYQGQMIEVGYALTPEGVVEREYDRSDGTVSYRVARWTQKLEVWADRGPWNVPPPSKTRWRKASAEEVDAILESAEG